MSVVIACRDEVATLPVCLDALAGQDLGSSRFEVILIDGGSTDGSMDVGLTRGARVLSDEGRGPSAARNVGIQAARGRIVAFTDADCVPRFDWLTRIVEAFEDPTVDGVAGGLRMSRETLVGRLEDNDARLHYHGYITSNVAYRRDALLAVGGFDESLLCAEDYDLAWRMLDAGHRIEHVPEAVVLHDPPEVVGGIAGYLRKQFWYARADVQTHARAMARRTPTGSALARAGFRHALGLSALSAGAVVGLALRSPWILAGAIGTVALASARHVRHAVRIVGEGETVRMSAVETARRLVRGAGTLAGVAGLARPAAWRTIRAPAPAWPRSPRAPLPLMA